MKRLCALTAAVLLAAAPLASAESRYRQPTFGSPWDTFVLEILIVPPESGQLVNDAGILAGGDIREVTPFQNSYLRAIERSIENWRDAIKRYAPRSFSSKLRIRDYVIGRDEVPRSALRDPEGVIVTTPHQLQILGVTFHHGSPSTQCVISNARFFTASFSYTDMLNVNTHELGHCLGGDHVDNGRPAHDVMVAEYVHNPGDAGTPKACPSNLNVKVVTRAFGQMFGKPATGLLSVAKDDYEQYAC